MRPLLLILILWLCTPSPLAAQDTQALLALGYQAIDRQEYAGAINAFKQVLQRNPRDTAALVGIIQAYILSENHREAERFIAKGIQEYPAYHEFYFRRGLLNNIRGQFRRALEDFDHALSLTSGAPAAVILVTRGVAHARLEDYSQAISDFALALRINPNNASALSQHGFANFRLGNFEDALRDFDRALALDPNNAMTLYNRAMSHLRLGNRPRACADFHQSCRRGNMNACRMIMAECQGVRQE